MQDHDPAPVRLGAHRWLLPYRSKGEPAHVTAWAAEQLETGVVQAEDRAQLLSELHRWSGTRGERPRSVAPRHSA